MKLCRLRKSIALALLAVAAARPSVEIELLVSELAHLVRGERHPHATSVVSEHGHLHVVLTHPESAPEEVSATHGHTTAIGNGGHVVHVPRDEVVTAAARRERSALAAALTAVALHPLAARAPAALCAPVVARGCDAEQLRTVVLRL